MRTVDFTKLGGLWVHQDTLAFMQNGYSDTIAALANIMGDKTVLAGCIEDGAGNVSDGWIVYDGKILPFVGGIITANIDVEILLTQEQYEDGNLKDAYSVTRLKLVTIATSTSFLYADLLRPEQYKNYWVKGDVKEVDCDAAYIAANFDISGLGIGERKGWAICNGSNGTKDRRGLFSIGYDDRTVDPANNIWDINYANIGATGGEKKHQLTVAELPNITKPTHQPVVGVTSAGGSGNQPWSPSNINFGGNDLPHNNIPPYLVTLFIQKV